MFEIHGNDIYISRGEAAVLNVTPYEDEEEYILDPLEHLEMSIYSIGGGHERKLLKTENGSTEFSFAAEDTKYLGHLDRLGYCVRLVFADGSRKTIIGPAPTFIPRFYLMEG